jgi:hypothetical protein
MIIYNLKTTGTVITLNTAQRYGRARVVVAGEDEGAVRQVERLLTTGVDTRGHIRSLTTTPEDLRYAIEEDFKMFEPELLNGEAVFEQPVRETPEGRYD